MYCFLFQAFYGMKIFGIRRLSLGRKNETKAHTTLVSRLHIELELPCLCAGILAVPGTWVFLLSLVGCYVWMQPRLEFARAKMRKRNDAHTPLNSSKKHQPPMGLCSYSARFGLRSYLCSRRESDQVESCMWNSREVIIVKSIKNQDTTSYFSIPSFSLQGQSI